MSVINKLRKIRLEKGINQTEMALACEVSRQTIHSIEVSKFCPSVEIALKIARELDMTIEEIFSLEGVHHED